MNIVKQGVFLTIVLACSLPAQARGPGPHGPGPGGMGRFHMNLEGIASELGVDQAVLEKIRNITYKADDEAISIRAELQRAHLQLRRLIEAEKPNTSKIMAAVETEGAIEIKLKKTLLLRYPCYD